MEEKQNNCRPLANTNMNMTTIKRSKNRCQLKQSTHPGSKNRQRAQWSLTWWTRLMRVVLKQRNGSQADSSNKRQSKGQRVMRRRPWKGMQTAPYHQTSQSCRSLQAVQELANSWQFSSCVRFRTSNIRAWCKSISKHKLKRWHLWTSKFTVKSIFFFFLQIYPYCHDFTSSAKNVSK